MPVVELATVELAAVPHNSRPGDPGFGQIHLQLVEPRELRCGLISMPPWERSWMMTLSPLPESALPRCSLQQPVARRVFVSSGSSRAAAGIFPDYLHSRLVTAP